MLNIQYIVDLDISDLLSFAFMDVVIFVSIKSVKFWNIYLYLKQKKHTSTKLKYLFEVILKLLFNN